MSIPSEPQRGLADSRLAVQHGRARKQVAPAQESGDRTELLLPPDELAEHGQPMVRCLGLVQAR